VLAFAVIKLTGSLTQKVLGTVKNILLVFYSVLFMGEHVTVRQWVGYNISLIGFVWYQCQKMSIAHRTSSRSRTTIVSPSARVESAKSHAFGYAQSTRRRSRSLDEYP
jgi:hypothetical protein